MIDIKLLNTHSNSEKNRRHKVNNYMLYIQGRVLVNQKYLPILVHCAESFNLS